MFGSEAIIILRPLPLCTVRLNKLQCLMCLKGVVTYVEVRAYSVKIHITQYTGSPKFFGEKANMSGKSSIKVRKTLRNIFSQEAAVGQRLFFLALLYSSNFRFIKRYHVLCVIHIV